MCHIFHLTRSLNKETGKWGPQITGNSIKKIRGQLFGDGESKVPLTTSSKEKPKSRGIYKLGTLKWICKWKQTGAVLEKGGESQLTLHRIEFICMSVEIFVSFLVFYALTFHCPEL